MAQFSDLKGIRFTQSFGMTGAGGETRTPNIQIRSLTLYPVELRPQTEKEDRILLDILSVEEEPGASEGAWTLDHWNHNPELYQLSYARHASNTNDFQYMYKVE